MGIEILYSPNGVVFTQRKYATYLLNEFQCDRKFVCPLPSYTSY